MLDWEGEYVIRIISILSRNQLMNMIPMLGQYSTKCLFNSRIATLIAALVGVGRESLFSLSRTPPAHHSTAILLDSAIGRDDPDISLVGPQVAAHLNHRSSTIKLRKRVAP